MLFSEYLQESIGKELTFKVYNLIQQGTRLVHIDLTSLAYESGIDPSSQIAEAILGSKLRYE